MTLRKKYSRMMKKFRKIKHTKMEVKYKAKNKMEIIYKF